MNSTIKNYPIKDFWINGFAGPFSLGKDEAKIDQVADFLGNMIQAKTGHPLYKRYSIRDWHLIEPLVLDLFQDEGAIAKLQQLLGEDLLLWRTAVFNKEPHEGTIGWHQEWGAFSGEEYGYSRPALKYSGTEDCWDLTVWIALCDMTLNMSPIRFAQGSHKKRYPFEMVPLKESTFYVDPFLEVNTVKSIVERSLSNTLLVDIDTSKIFEEADLMNQSLTIAEAKARVMRFLDTAKGAVIVGFNDKEQEVVNLEIKKGQYWIFTERVMHGSGVNTSTRSRLAINGRIARGETLVYPGRLTNEFIDGTNLNIKDHKAVILSGGNKEPRNNVIG